MRKFLINLFSADEKRVSTLIVALFMLIGYGFMKGFNENIASMFKWLVIGIATVNVAPGAFTSLGSILASSEGNMSSMYGSNMYGNSYGNMGYSTQQYGTGQCDAYGNPIVSNQVVNQPVETVQTDNTVSTP